MFSPNMSVGVNLAFRVLALMAKALGDDYDVEITEIHHRMKKDAPSGTAAKMAEVIAEALGRRIEDTGVYGRHGLVGERTTKEIGVHALRGGDVVGEHTVVFSTVGERLESTHRAHSRDTFAQGALRAARFVAAARPGLYSMHDVLGLDGRAGPMSPVRPGRGPSDILFVEDIRFYGHHGVTSAQQEVGAWFSVDVELALDLTPAALSDDLEQGSTTARWCNGW